VDEIRERNVQIVEMRRAGYTYRAVAEHFDRSPSLAQQVVRRFKRQEELSEQSRGLLEQLRKSDDVRKKWDAIALVSGLLLPSRVTKVLIRHFAAHAVREISLLDLMDMMINDSNPDELFGVAVGFRIKHIGENSFCAIVARLMDLDLGSNANREWARRTDVLRGTGRWTASGTRTSAADGCNTRRGCEPKDAGERG
jgi:hypothetical protein